MSIEKKTLAALLLTALFSVESLAAPPACAEEILSVAVNPLTEDYVLPFHQAMEAGCRGQTVTWRWSDLEPDKDQYDLAQAIENVQFLCKEMGFSLLVNLAVIDMSAKQFPRELQPLPFNSKEVILQFHELIDQLALLMDPRVEYIVVGHEVDLYLAAHPQEWNAYMEFYEDASDYIRLKMPGVKVGVCVTSAGAKGADAGHILALNKRSDVWVTTYYPMGERFRPVGTDTVLVDLPEMVRTAGNLPLVIQEIGFPSAVVLESSERAQADFVANTFAAWSAQRDRIPFLSFWIMHDLPEEECRETADSYGMGNDSFFKAFFCSLGLRRSDGSPKPAWSALEEGSRRMGLIR
ncbi:MAG: hypothetical protein NC819_03665 [Candidatus Omnitrophica bacterium]|nr:hypothetical protein [Candidatus Omnitrophota bacterium]